MELLKYDKAIFHLVTSLQDNKLKKIFNKALSDEYDDNDVLINKIYILFHSNKEIEKNNMLVEKQHNNLKINYSHKDIGILINSRYNKLINVYFKFFSLIQKLNIKALDGLFINTLFHNINYYHKILIQYIYLCYVKNDLVKIGESILDYIEFLIKFKFKTSFDNKYILDIRGRKNPDLIKKQNLKKIIFNKIINWFNLFDEYVDHVLNNTSLADEKILVKKFSTLLSKKKFGNQSLFLFKINLQRAEFLKGKFALRCKNYTDALFFFIKAAKKKSIIIDGLIRKKSLKRIYKILIMLYQKYNDYDIIKFRMKEKIKEYETAKKIQFIKKKSNIIQYNINNKYNNKEKDNSFKILMNLIKNGLLNDIGESNTKQTKDIIIIIDFNIYNEKQNNIDKINSFIDQTIIILDNYLSRNDRFGVFIHKNQYQIICPMQSKYKIDLNNFTNDLIYNKIRAFNEIKEEQEINSNDINENNLEKDKIDINSDNQKLLRVDSQESFQNDDKKIKNNDNIIKSLFDSINYIQKYLRLKEDIKHEKFIILFTDIFSTYKMNDEIIISNLNHINKEKEITFLLVGKNMNKMVGGNKSKIDLDEKTKLNKIILDKFGEGSEIIDFENMKKIENILSNNDVIKDEIIYPNEIYK